MASSVTAKIFLNIYADQITKLLQAFLERFNPLLKFIKCKNFLLCPFDFAIEKALLPKST